MQNNYPEHIAQANANSTSSEAFTKRFFGWFDGLKTVKYPVYQGFQSGKTKMTVKVGKHIMIFKRTGFIQRKKEKSRRDGILLTVDFNLRTKNAPRSLQSLAGTTQGEDKVGTIG